MTEPCPYPEDLSAYLDGELPPRVRSRIERHEASCAACSALLADLRGLRSEFRALPDERLGFDLAQVIRGRIEVLPPQRQAPRAPRWRSLLPVGVGAAASVSLGVALGLSLTAPVVIAPAMNALEVFAPVAPGGLCPGTAPCWRPGPSTGRRP